MLNLQILTHQIIKTSNKVIDINTFPLQSWMNCYQKTLQVIDKDIYSDISG